MKQKELTLSEAILAGSKVTRKANGVLFRTGATCALGSAYVGGALTGYQEFISSAAFRQENDEVRAYAVLTDRWPLLAEQVVNPTIPTDYLIDTLENTITDLNDNHGWSRQMIAYYVQCVERGVQFIPKACHRKRMSARALGYYDSLEGAC